MTIHTQQLEQKEKNYLNRQTLNDKCLNQATKILNPYVTFRCCSKLAPLKRTKRKTLKHL